MRRLLKQRPRFSGDVASFLRLEWSIAVNRAVLYPEDMNKKKLLRRLVLVVILALIVLGAWRVFFARAPMNVEVQRVGRGVVEELVTNSRAGSIRARYRSQIGSEIAGRVALMPYREGAEVDSATVLVRLLDDMARARVSLAQRDLESAQANLLAAESKAEFQASELARAEGLIVRGAVTQESVDAVRSSDKAARAEFDAARAQLERARAALQLARVELARHQVCAPFAGVVNQLYVEVGASVIPGQPVLELMSRTDLYVSAPMDELDIGRIHVGQEARVTLDPYPDRSFDATVARIAPFVSEFQEQNRTLEVELLLQDIPSEVTLHPGTSADVEIIIGRRNDVLRVPALALLEGESVLLVDEGKAVSRQIQIGLRNWDWIEVLDGLEADDEIITSLDRGSIKPGSRVLVEQADGG